MASDANDVFIKVGSPGTATTLSSPGYTSGVSTSINVGSTTNWPTDTGIIFAIDEVTTVNGVQVRTAGTYNEFEGTVASATQITNVDYVGGDAERTYAAGASTRVYIPVSAERENRLITGLTAGHNQLDGDHQFTTNYDPANPTLETQKWAGVASAVNEVQVTNAATGNAPFIDVTGGDTNVGLDLSSKGTGGITLWAGTKARELLKLVNVASAVNEVQISPAATGNRAEIKATGEANAGLHLTGSGTGNVLVDAYNPYKFSAYRNAAWTASATLTKVAFDTELFDTNSNFDATTNNRYTAPVAGFYLFTTGVSVNTSNGAANFMQLRLYKNGSVMHVLAHTSVPAVNIVTTLTGSALVELAASDYVEVFFAHDLAAPGATGSDETWFTGHLVSRT